MSSSPSEIYPRLSDRGQRLTRTRRAVVEALHASARPMTAREVQDVIGPANVDLVTVYRTASWLLEHGVARQVSTGPGAERYELADAADHTHHLRCDRCGTVLTVAVCGMDPAIYERIRAEYGFVVRSHAITFHGLCADCAGLRN